MNILYEDNHVIAVFKPAGILVQPEERGGDSLMDQVKKYLKEKYKKPGNVFLGLVHRLDRNVSGIVLYGKTSKGANRLSEQFRNHEIKKIYNALIEGKINPPRRELVNYLKKDEKKLISLVSDRPREGYSRSSLFYQTVKSSSNHSLLKIDLETGRFHQIRSQLAYAGYPIVGDRKYGSKENLSDGSIALCATEVGFKPATGGNVINLRIDPPFVWDDFLK